MSQLVNALKAEFANPVKVSGSIIFDEMLVARAVERLATLEAENKRLRAILEEIAQDYREDPDKCSYCGEQSPPATHFNDCPYDIARRALDAEHGGEG